MIKLFAYLRGAVRSWTIWINGVLLTLIVAAPQISEVLPQLQPYLQDSSYKLLTVVTLLLNLALRVKTRTALSDKSTEA